MTLNVLLHCVVNEYHDAFVCLYGGNDYSDVFFLKADIDTVFLVLCDAIKISPEINTDFECSHPKLEICYKS